MTDQNGGEETGCAKTEVGAASKLPELSTAPLKNRQRFFRPEEVLSAKAVVMNTLRGTENANTDEEKRNSFHKVTIDFSQGIGMSTDEDLLVKRLAKGGQAELLGVRQGMRVVAVGDFIVQSESQLQSAVQKYLQWSISQGLKNCSVLFIQSQ